MNIKENNIKRVGIYCRVSSNEQVKNGTSLENQREKILAYVNSLNLMSHLNEKYTIDENNNIYIDGGYSGGDDERPSLQKMMTDVRNGKLDIIIVYKLDRFFRKNLLLLKYLEELHELDVSFKSLMEDFNINESQGKLMISMFGSFAELERDIIKERTINGKIKKAEDGFFIGGGIIKYGYEMYKENGGNKLKIVKDESKIINKIFNLYLEGLSINQISKILSEEGVLTRYDKKEIEKEKEEVKYENKKHNLMNNINQNKKNKKKMKRGFWHNSTVKKILSSEIYIGKYKYRQTYRKLDYKTKKYINITREEGDENIIEIKVPSIVDKEIFYKAQELLKKNKKILNNKVVHKFTSFVKCGECGRYYRGYKTYKGTFSYRCGGKYSSKVPKENRCTNSEVSEKYLFEVLWNKVSKLLRKSDDFLEDYYYKNNNLEDSSFSLYEEELREINLKNEKFNKSIRNAYDELFMCDEDKEFIRDGIKNLKKNKKNNLERKEFIESKMENFLKVKENKSNINRFISKFNNNLKKLDDNKKISVIKEMLDKVIIYKNGYISVSFKFYIGHNIDNQDNLEEQRGKSFNATVNTTII